MMIELAFYLFLNALRVYILYRFVGLFFHKASQRKCTQYCYLVYYAINCAVYLLVDFDKLNLTVNVLGLLSVVLLSYEGSYKRKLLSVLASIGMSLLTENIAWVIFLKGKDGKMLEYALFFSIFALFLLEVIIEKTIKFRKGVELSVYKDLLLILTFVGSMFIANVMVEGIYHNKVMLIIALCTLLVINITVFYLYEKLLDDYERKKEEQMHRVQLEMFQNQLEIMRNANASYKNMRHDMRHHALMLSEYIGKDEKEKAIKYLEKMNSYIEMGRQYVETGNECIDCIFNYVIGEVNKIGGKIETDIKIGEDFFIDDFNINIILSNLLLNAYEAIKKSGKKEIFAFMRFDRGVLKIKIRNTYNGDIVKNSMGFQSVKKIRLDMGLGFPVCVRQLILLVVIKFIRRNCRKSLIN